MNKPKENSTRGAKSNNRPGRYFAHATLQLSLTAKPEGVDNTTNFEQKLSFLLTLYPSTEFNALQLEVSRAHMRYFKTFATPV